jgi:hypothetical protein
MLQTGGPGLEFSLSSIDIGFQPFELCSMTQSNLPMTDCDEQLLDQQLAEVVLCRA